jgi:c(7)-type cytochrome triheme protein
MKFGPAMKSLCKHAILTTALLFSANCGSDGPPASLAEFAQAPKPHISAPAPVNPPPPPLWRPLASDGVHDPSNEVLSYLQEPEEALSLLPRSEPGGNDVDWVKALASGAITPRARIEENTEVRILDKDIVMPNTAGMPLVVFPHRQHTEWLDCSNCHDKIFVAKTGGNDFGMEDVLKGNYCGQCHGAVSFPLTQCYRCHSKDPARK